MKRTLDVGTYAITPPAILFNLITPGAINEILAITISVAVLFYWICKGINEFRKTCKKNNTNGEAED